MKTTDNHIFIGKEDKLNNWAGHKDVDRDELTEEEMGKLTKKVKELIKNYLQLDNVNFLFGRLFHTSWGCQHSKYSIRDREVYSGFRR